MGQAQATVMSVTRPMAVTVSVTSLEMQRAAVLGLGGLDDLGHENRVEHAAGNEHVDEVGEGVRGFEDVTDGRERTDSDGEQDGLDESEDARDERTCGHDCA